MKLAVIGSRSITDKALVFNEIAKMITDVIPKGPICILSGGAIGVDTLAKDFADANNIDHIVFKPYFILDSKSPYNVRHFFVRNGQLIRNADFVLFIWDGESTGTKAGIELADKLGKHYVVAKITK